MSARFRYGNVRLRFEHWPVIWLWPVSLVLMQVTLAEIGDFSVTVAVIVCHLLQLHLVMFYWLRRPPDWQTTMALVILAYGAVAGLPSPEILGSSCAASRTSPISCSRS